MTYSSAFTPTDRRVRRTREVLQQASIEVMRENGFLGTTIQQITDRANVNRGTFYAHYPDKYALLNDVIHVQFQQLLVSALPPFSSWNWGTVRHLIQIVVENFEEEYSQCHPAEVMHPVIVRANQDILTNMLFNWLTWESPGRQERASQQVQKETMARVMSWTIVGAAAHWSPEENDSRPSKQIAQDILSVLMEGIAAFVPQGFLAQSQGHQEFSSSGKAAI
jgi:AcrR family transcriptional regulator